MKLYDLLEKKHNEIGIKKSTSKINDVYGIIYRIFCITENKSYIGQTFSHGYSNNKIIRKGIITRIKQHFNDKDLEKNKDKPLYKALQKYDTEDFEVYIENELYEKDIRLINIKEGEYMKKYNTLHPNGYNTEEIGKKYPKILKDLAELYDFEIEKYTYIDTTRNRRAKDICIGTYFNISSNKINLDKVLEYLKKIEIDKVTLTESNGLRILVKPKNEKDNIRIYFHNSREECVKYAEKISKNIIITSKFYGKDIYKYQDKLDKVLIDKDTITTTTGNCYYNDSRKCYTYLIMISGIKNKRTQTLHRISFGGKNIDIKDSYKTSLEFIEKLKENIPDIKYIINEPCL